ncbi:hypothetical protein CR513_59301, partial [Mucuna pruriens]
MQLKDLVQIGACRRAKAAINSQIRDTRCPHSNSNNSRKHHHQSAGSGNLSSQTIPNPRGNASVVSLRSRKELQVSPQQKPRSASTESKSDADSQPPQ